MTGFLGLRALSLRDPKLIPRNIPLDQMVNVFVERNVNVA